MVVAAIFTGGLSALALGSICASAPLIIAGTVAVSSSPFLLIIGTPVVATVRSAQVDQSNHMIKKDIKEKSMHDALIIEPGETVDTLIFVERNYYKPNFEITFPHHNQKPTVFDINLE